MVNNSRNLAIKLNTFIPKENNGARQTLMNLIPNYAYALKEHLRGRFKPGEFEGVTANTSVILNKADHVPNKIAGLIVEEVNALYTNKQISGNQLILLNAELSSFTDIAGACERIKRTPIPYSYSLFIKKFIFIYVMTMPFGFINDFKYWTIPIVILMFYVLTSLELIAEEIEDPFGVDSNDLPTDDIAERIRVNVKEIMNA